MHRSKLNIKAAFSLIEVTVAIGIISFCALAVMGLLPVAVNSYRRGYDQSQATTALNAFANGLHTLSISNGYYVMPYPFTSTKWPTNVTTINGTNQSTTNGTNSMDWLVDGIGNRYTLYYTVTAPTNGAGYQAYVSIAWPSTAGWQDSATNVGWTNAAGSVESTIYFNPPGILYP